MQFCGMFGRETVWTRLNGDVTCVVQVAQRLRLGDRTTSALETLRLQHSRGAVSGDSGVELDPALNNHNHNHSPQNHAAAEPAANHLA